MSQKHQPKRSWKGLILDWRYQLLFALPMVLLAAALWAGLGTVAMHKVQAATKVGLHLLDVTAAGVIEQPEEVKAELLRREEAIQWGMIAGGILLCAGIFLFGVKLTHRVAGPLHRIGASLEKLAQGSIEVTPEIRHTDGLADFHAVYVGACETLRAREQQEVDLYRRVVRAAEPELTGAVKRLKECLRSKERGLG